MTKTQILAHWQARRKELERLGALVNAASLYDEVLADFESFTEYDRLLTLTEAATHSGYSADHLGRQIREKKIPNSGRPNAPRIRLSDLPIKPGHLPPAEDACDLTPTSKRQVVRSIVGREKEATR